MRIWISGHHKRICESVGYVITRGLLGSILIFQVASISGCASGSASNDAKRVHALERKLKKQSAHLQDLRERNFVLEKRNLNRSLAAATESEPGLSMADSSDAAPVMVPGPAPAVAPKTAFAKSIAPKPAAPLKSGAPLSVSPEKTSEHYLYAKILETYRARNPREMETTLGLLLKSYPESVFADNALYLSGLMAFENGDLNGAKAKFDRLLKEFPRSNKAVAALFAKASIERKSGRANEAKCGFVQVRDLFPGSPEAARVAVELKLIESASLKKREI